MQPSKLSQQLFSKPKTLRLGGIIEIIDEPKVMGILNLTSDSFYDGGKYQQTDEMLNQTAKMLNEGAFIIDIGCQSTRSGAKEIGADAELEILIPALKILTKEFPSSYFSIDTYYSTVAEQAVENGAVMINDISGGQFDPQMFETIARLNVPYILMHTQEKPEIMQQNPHYENVLKEVLYYFSERLEKLHKLGVSDILLDPGFGFGKTQEHNFELMAQLEHFRITEKLLVLGISRKSMIWKTLNINPQSALNGTTSLHTVALEKGADFLRVHDVREALEVINLHKSLKKSLGM